MIENYMGFPRGIAGAELAERARQQAVKFGIELLMMQEGVRGEFHDNRIWVDLADGSKMVARANICATGVEWRRLGLPNEQRLLGAGLYYGAGLSEAPLCRDQHVVVIGGGNSAGQAVMHFSAHARRVTMLVRGSSLGETLSDYLASRILREPNVDVRYDSEVTGLDGDGFLSRMAITDRGSGAVDWLDTRRVFVCIGGVPNTDWAKDTPIVRDQVGYLVTGADLLEGGKPPKSWPLERPPFYLETSVPGSFAAGDVRRNSIKRVASAVGEGAMAVAFVHRYLQETA
jgi:thioredoxin reductase (NADPH)